MKSLTVISVLLLAGNLVVLADNDFNEAAEKEAIQSVLDAHGAAWTRGDARQAAATLTADADWVSGSGLVLHGRAAIEQYHQDLLSGPAKGSRHSHPGRPEIRFVRHDVAIVDGDSYIEGLQDSAGKEMPGDVSRYRAIFVKQNGKWLVTAFRSLPQVKVTTAH